MFARFHQTPSRLQVSLRESCRIGGKPRCEHIASLGSIALPMTIAGRVEFFHKLSERLRNLSNRIGDERAKIVNAIVGRIPRVTDDDIAATKEAMDFEKAIRDAGLTAKDVRRFRQVAYISEMGAFDELLQETTLSVRRAEAAAHRRVLRKVAIEELRRSDDQEDKKLVIGFDRVAKIKAARARLLRARQCRLTP